MDVITGEFRDLASCTAMSLSKSGNLAFIAGRRAYGLVDLDKPEVGTVSVLFLFLSFLHRDQ
jgi:hypothetical protein